MKWRQSFTQLSTRVNARLDDLFPRPWLEDWNHARQSGWKPDAPDAYCQYCGCTIHATAQVGGRCAFCINQRFSWSKLTRLCEYNQPMVDWVHQLKFQKQWSWAKLLGGELGKIIPPPAEPGNTLVCPVPMHPWRRIRRGYNQSAIIAKAIAREHRLPVVNVLKRVELRPPQSSLSLTARKANVRHAFAAKDIDLTDWCVWLVDDVKTSGSTMRACSRLLKYAGAKQVDLAVLAVADPKGAHFSKL